MACYRIYDKAHKPLGFICGNLGAHCADCGDVGDNLCDYPVGKGKTCDRPMCDYCANEVAPDVHYCAGHLKEWEAFKQSGGVTRELENVVPFKTKDLSMTATISPCGTYRYLLTRHADMLLPERGTALFIMLNPSTADSTLDDPTIRRCKGFAKLWGCNGMAVANLYALRSTDPAGLWAHPDPVGPDNDKHLYDLAKEYGDVIVAWGTNAKQARIDQVVKIFTDAGARLFCLGVTKDGHPRHPLYVAANQPLINWPVAA